MSNEKIETGPDPISKLITKLTIVHRSRMEKAMCDIGLHSGQSQILMVLWENDGLSQASLVMRLSVSAPTINKMVKRLVQTGFATNDSCPNDGRLKRVHLTKKGFSIRNDVERQLESLNKTIFEGFSDTEKILAPILLQKIIFNLQTKPSES